jgi:hypothetical protein
MLASAPLPAARGPAHRPPLLAALAPGRRPQPRGRVRSLVHRKIGDGTCLAPRDRRAIYQRPPAYLLMAMVLAPWVAADDVRGG